MITAQKARLLTSKNLEEIIVKYTEDIENLIFEKIKESTNLGQFYNTLHIHIPKLISNKLGLYLQQELKKELEQLEYGIETTGIYWYIEW